METEFKISQRPANDAPAEERAAWLQREVMAAVERGDYTMAHHYNFSGRACGCSVSAAHFLTGCGAAPGHVHPGQFLSTEEALALEAGYEGFGYREHGSGPFFLVGLVLGDRGDGVRPLKEHGFEAWRAERGL